MLSITTFILICIVYIVFKVLAEQNGRRDLSTLSGPWYPSFPGIGQSYLLLGDTFQKIKNMTKRYGPIYRFDIGPLPTVVVSSLDLFREAYGHPSIQGRPYNALDSFPLMMNGHGLQDAIPGFAGSQGQNWKEQRRFVEMELKQNSVDMIGDIIAEEAENLIGSLKTKAEEVKSQGKTLVMSLHQFFMPATINIVWRLCTGQTLPADHPKIINVVNKIYEFFKFLKPGPNSFLQLKYPWLMKLANIVGITNGMNTYGNLVEVILREIENNEFNDLSQNKLAARYNEEAKKHGSQSSFYGTVGKRNLVATLADLFMGGADTTNNQMEWIMLFLTMNSEYQERIREEITSVVGENGTLMFEHIEKMPFFESFLMEVMRLRPIAPMALPRLAMENCNINGYSISKNTQVLVDLSAILLDPKNFKNPEKFDPERFLKHDGDKSLILKIFGAGKRRCPGEKIARNEMFVLIGKMVRTFQISPTKETLDNYSAIMHGIFGLNHVPLPYTVELKLIN